MKQHRYKIILASIVGNLLEWYDFALIGIFATIFAKHFFPTGDPAAALVGTLGIFAVGYLMRPLGGLIIGHFGDKKSRQRALIATLLLMGTVTTLIGLLPTYSSIGLWATVLLILLRIMQGLAVGGEFPGSIVILSEQANTAWRAVTATLALVGALLGVLAGSAVANILAKFLSPDALYEWGWRIPFLMGIILAILGLYVRIKIWPHEDIVNLAEHTLPVLQLIKHNKLALLKTFCILSFGAVLTGVLSIFFVTYLTHYLQLPLAFAFKLLFISSLIMLVSFPLSALIADYFNIHKPWLLAGMLVVIVTTYPLFLLMQHGELACTIAISLLSFITVFAYAPMFPLIIDLFPKQVRFSGIAIMHGLAFSIIAGTTPLFMNWFVLKWGTTSPAYYLMGAAVFVLLATIY